MESLDLGEISRREAREVKLDVVLGGIPFPPAPRIIVGIAEHLDVAVAGLGAHGLGVDGAGDGVASASTLERSQPRLNGRDTLRELFEGVPRLPHRALPGSRPCQREHGHHSEQCRRDENPDSPSHRCPP